MAIWAVELDFETKEHREIGAEAVPAAIEAGRYVWIDIQCDDLPSLETEVRSLDLIEEQIIEDVVSGEEATQIARYHDALHLAVCGCRFDDDDLVLERFDAIAGHGFLMTTHVGPRAVLNSIRREYVADFVRHAGTPSFLIFELWDHLADHYVETQKKLERKVETLQRDLFDEDNDDVFQHVSEIGADILRFRSLLMPARAILSELSTRRSIFVSEATQPYLQNIVGTIERVLQDVLVDRDSLTQALSLYLSMVGHRTNRAMSKLTVISVIFLPLTFLCGVYGMNFELIPELRWEYGYAGFWFLVFAITLTMVLVMRRARLL